MYKTFMLLSLFILINGCATDSGGAKLSGFYSESSENIYAYGSKKVEKYEDLQTKYKAEALNLTTGQRVVYGNNDASAYSARHRIITLCEEVLLSKWKVARNPDGSFKKNECILSRYQDEIYYKDFDSYYEEQKIIAVELEKEKRLQKEIILAGLLSRCENFGWKSDDDLASCVQQEAYRDLQLEKQKREIKILEQKLELAQNKSVDDEPLFFMFLDAYAQSKQQDNMLQMKKDIARLKASNAYKGSRTETLLKSLYRTNN